LKVRWTMPAVNQLQHIFDYIAEDNPAAAERTLRHILEAILRAVRMPSVGRTGRIEGTREITVPGTPYLVTYRIVEKMVHVLAILHGTQEWPASF